MVAVVAASMYQDSGLVSKMFQSYALMTFEIVMVFDAVGFGVAYPRVDFSEKMVSEQHLKVENCIIQLLQLCSRRKQALKGWWS